MKTIKPGLVFTHPRYGLCRIKKGRGDFYLCSTTRTNGEVLITRDMIVSALTIEDLQARLDQVTQGLEPGRGGETLKVKGQVTLPKEMTRDSFEDWVVGLMVSRGCSFNGVIKVKK